MIRRTIIIVRKLIFPLAFLKVRHPDNYIIYFIAPIFLSFIVFVFDLFLVKIQFFADNGLVVGITTLTGILTGFYIAALAAVATFNKPDMDEEMRGAPPDEKISLTRRQYLCLLFGYLAFMSVSFYILGISASSIVGQIRGVVPDSYFFIVRHALILIYFSIFFNILCVTLLGIYFLTYGIHRDFPKITKSK